MLLRAWLCWTDKLARYFVGHKFLLSCSVHKDRNGAENEVISIPDSYRGVPGSNTGQEAGSAGLMFRDYPQSLTKKFRGGGGCGDMMIIIISSSCSSNNNTLKSSIEKVLR